MFFVGIDIGKSTHEASIVDSQGNILKKSLRFANSHHGANKLKNYVSSSCSSEEQVVFGLEATGHYWLSIYSFLMNQGFNVCVINPIQTDSFREFYIRKTKTDKKDSYIIAEVIRFGQFSSSQLSDEKVLSLKQLSRYRLSLVDNAADLKRRVIAILDQVFPEYEKLFSNVFGKASKQILLEYTTPEEIINIDTDILADILSQASRGRLGLNKATTIQQNAANSFGIKLGIDAFSFEIRQLIYHINFIEEQIKQVEQQIEELFNKLDSHLASIPGIGPILGAIILSEIGDISRFNNGAALVAYAGIDPSIKQSGQFSSNKNRMSKRGSPYLRRAIWLAASVAVHNDTVLSNYYQKKKSEGKHHLTAIGAAARKLTYIIYAILRDQKDYVPIA